MLIYFKIEFNSYYKKVIMINFFVIIKIVNNWNIVFNIVW